VTSTTCACCKRKGEADEKGTRGRERSASSLCWCHGVTLQVAPSLPIHQKEEMAPRGAAKQDATKKSSPSDDNNDKQLLEPPFSLYEDTDAASFDEGWSSVLQLLRGKKKIVVLTGAGISVSCGIPDFRSKGSGLYSTLDAEELGLSCPEDLFDASSFQENPQPFYKFARQVSCVRVIKIVAGCHLRYPLTHVV